jgi:hypothetical protein
MCKLFLYRHATAPFTIAWTNDPAGLLLPDRPSWKKWWPELDIRQPYGEELKRVFEAFARDGYMIMRSRTPSP